MNKLGLFLLIFWITLIVFPDIIAYILWWVLVFFGLNMILFFSWFKWKASQKDYVQFWNYKIYKK